MTTAIPTLNIEALSSPDAATRRQTAAEIGRACRDTGFFVIRGHGLPDRLIDRTTAGNVGRLQVQARDGQWIEIPALKGAFVCNVGDCLMRWTHDVYVSTPHRVLSPQRERYSIVLFFDANPDAIVSALPGSAATDSRHAPISVSDYLKQRAAAPPIRHTAA